MKAKLKRFHLLPKSIRSELEERLMGGDSMLNVATWLSEQGYCLDISQATLIAYLQDYAYSAGLFRKQMRNYLGEISAAVKALKSTMTPEEGYQFLVHVQFERVMAGYEEEKISGRMNPALAKEISLLERILKNMSDIDIDRNLRFLKRIGETESKESGRSGLYDSLCQSYGESAARAAFDPSSRHKVLSLLETLSSRIDGPLKRIIDRQRETIDVIPEENKSDG